jgi:plasmid stabilization system protein ParE
MAGGKKREIIISPQAKEDIESILRYLSENWNQNVIDDFLKKLELFYSIISINPHIFGFYSKHRNIRNYAISKHNVIYYRNRRKVIEIITVFGTKQSPSKLRKALSK